MIRDLEDTIAAVASAPGGAARGIIRVSGPRALACVSALCDAPLEEDEGCAKSRRRGARVEERELRCDSFASAVPCTLYVWRSSLSYTRQPAVEIHTLGSPPILQGLLASLCAEGRARLALPGEFTLRAFMAGRLDLLQAEGVLGVIDAHSRRSLDAALSQMAGGLGDSLRHVRSALLDTLAHVEAGLDFVEDDITFIGRDELARELAAAAATVDELIARSAARGLVGDTPRAVLVGRANVGKSSLFNALLAHSAAIVSPAAGTTRDYLVARLTIDDVELELIDTAGTLDAAAKDASTDTSSTGVSLLDSAAERAAAGERARGDIEIMCLDATRPMADDEREALEQTPAAAVRIVAVLKSDLPTDVAAVAEGVRVSSLTGAGLTALRGRLREAVVQCRAAEPLTASAVRCGDSLRRAAEALQRAQLLAADSRGEELIAVEIRAALDGLGEVVGAVYTDDILDRVFSRFCIGK